MNTQIDTIKRDLVQTTEMAKVDESYGVYRPFSIMYKHQGGDADPFALRATLNYVAKCTKMQQGWMRYNDMTERMEYLEVENRRIETFRRAWSNYETRSTSIPANRAAADDGQVPAEKTGEDGLPAQVLPGPPKPQVLPPAPPKGPKESKEDAKKAPKEKTDLEKAWISAVALKREFSNVITAGESVLHHSTGDSTWATLHGDLELVREALKKMRQTMSPFASDFVMKDNKQIRKDFRGADVGLQTACKNFTDTMETQIAEVNRATRRVIAMHSARSAVE